MNMRSYNYLTILLLTLTFISCKEIREKNKINNDKLSEVESIESRQKLLIDYKKDTYQISVGENYKTSEKIIDWHWAALNDPDDKIDSIGKDAFLYLGEPLINYNSGEWLPSLHIETFRLTKGEKYEYDRFEYIVKPR